MFFQIHPGQLDFKSEKQGPNEEIPKSENVKKSTFLTENRRKMDF